jgi:hypothetical protein
VDGHGKDPLLAGSGWNLDARTYGDCMAFLKEFQMPTLVLGGGGYNSVLAARCWACVTLQAVGLQSIEGTPESDGDGDSDQWDIDIPEHDFWTEYGPEYRLLEGAESRNGEDLNLRLYRDIGAEIFSNEKLSELEHLGDVNSIRYDKLLEESACLTLSKIASSSRKHVFIH